MPLTGIGTQARVGARCVQHLAPGDRVPGAYRTRRLVSGGPSPRSDLGVVGTWVLGPSKMVPRHYPPTACGLCPPAGGWRLCESTRKVNEGAEGVEKLGSPAGLSPLPWLPFRQTCLSCPIHPYGGLLCPGKGVQAAHHPISLLRSGASRVSVWVAQRSYESGCQPSS